MQETPEEKLLEKMDEAREQLSEIYSKIEQSGRSKEAGEIGQVILSMFDNAMKFRKLITEPKPKTWEELENIPLNLTAEQIKELEKFGYDPEEIQLAGKTYKI
ncbi:hypothetical protein ES702_02302 [subsurface metagenome]